MRRTKGTQQGRNLGVGKGFFFFFSLRDGEKPSLDSGREKAAVGVFFNTQNRLILH